MLPSPAEAAELGAGRALVAGFGCGVRRRRNVSIDYDNPIPPGRFGGVTAAIGNAQQGVDVRHGRLPNRDADTDREAQFLRADSNRVAFNLRAQAFRVGSRCRDT
jgi:hypothetical protein